jgi:hypothetical protein
MTCIVRSFSPTEHLAEQMAKRNFFAGGVFNLIDAKKGNPERLKEVRCRKDLRAQKGPKNEILYNVGVAWYLFSRGT